MSERILRINYAALSVRPAGPDRRNNRQRFRCWRDDGSPVGPVTGLRSPALDGARWLVGQGVSPDRLMTIRAASSSVDSWKPASVGSFAKLSVQEPDNGPKGARFAVWKAQPWSPAVTETATTPPAGVAMPEKPQGGCSARSAVPFRPIGEIVASLIDVPSCAGDDASIPASASLLCDAAQSAAACDLRAACAHLKGTQNGF